MAELLNGGMRGISRIGKGCTPRLQYLHGKSDEVDHMNFGMMEEKKRVGKIRSQAGRFLTTD
jgi:hypothetical protein